MSDAFSIFIDPRYNSVFAQTASLQGAKDEVNFDVGRYPDDFASH